jgi:hypothetical protein
MMNGILVIIREQEIHMWNLDEELVNAEIAKKLGDNGGDVADK